MNSYDEIDKTHHCRSVHPAPGVVKGSRKSFVYLFYYFYMLKQSRSVCKSLKAAKDHFTSAKLNLLYTDFRDIFYKTLDWDLYSHVPLLTVVHFVLQYLPKICILSPSPFPPPVISFLSSLHLFLCLPPRRSQEREVQARRQMLEEERRRREEAERRLQDETAHRQRLVEEEVKMREKHFSQVSGAAGGDGRREEERGGSGGRRGRETWGRG